MRGYLRMRLGRWYQSVRGRTPTGTVRQMFAASGFVLVGFFVAVAGLAAGVVHMLRKL